MTAKRLLIIVSVLFVLSLGSLLVYNYFFQSASPGTETGDNGALPSAPAGQNKNNGTGGAGSLPGGNGSQTGQNQTSLKIKPISKEPVLSPTIGADGQTVKYYARSNGNVWSSDFMGANLKKISAVTLPGLIKALWSPDKAKVIGLFSDNNKIKKYFYDYDKNQSALLDEKVGFAAWSPDSKRIA